MNDQPRYPVYIVSKGRPGKYGLTARFFIKDGLDFKIVVEPQEAEQYAQDFGSERILVLPFSNLGQGSIPARNWIWEHSRSLGYDRHWIFDDNIRQIYRRYEAIRINCNAKIALRAIEDFTDRYTNLAICGMDYAMFVPDNRKFKPFYVNTHVYSSLLIQNDLPYRWRGRYNEDTDLCLQVLSGGLCTVLVNVFLIQKIRTMVMKGGNSDQLYQNDGRLRMARSLERMWPGVVETKRRFKRPQHVIKYAWKKFDTPLKRKEGIELPSEPFEYGMQLIQVKPQIKSQHVKKLKDQFARKNGGNNASSQEPASETGEASN